MRGGIPDTIIEALNSLLENKPAYRDDDAFDLVEELAALEHDQWASWAEDILETETITPDRAARWRTLIDTPYDGLSEQEKEKDRVWAIEILNLLLTTEMFSIVALNHEGQSTLYTYQATATPLEDIR